MEIPLLKLTYHISFNLFQANVPILYLVKTPETKGFLLFSGGIIWEHWPEMG